MADFNEFPDKQPPTTEKKYFNELVKPASDFLKNEVSRRNLAPDFSQLVKYEMRKQGNLIHARTRDNQPLTEQRMPTIGIPDDWDYKTSELGPNQEQLPPGAVGWTKFGEPYYGGNNPFEEWMNPLRMRNSIWRDVSGTSVTELKEQRKEFRVAAKDALFSGKFGDAFVNAISALGTTFGEILPKKLKGETGEALLTETGEKTDRAWLAGGSRAIGEVLQGLGVTIDALTSRPLKQAISFAQGQQEIVEKYGGESFTGVGDVIGGGIRDWASTMPDNVLSGAVRFVAGAFENITPVEWVVNSWKATQLVDRETLFNEDFTNWHAGRVLYSSFIDPATREEYKRRYLEGENPYLLELELQNPIAEAAGEIIFDPLNVVAKAAAAKRIAASNAKAAEKIGKATVSVDKLRDATKAEDLIEVATDVGKVNERIAKATSEIKLGPLGRTRVGAQNYMQRLAAHWISQDLKHVGGNPTQWFEIVKAKARLASPDLVTRQKAIQYLMSEGIPINAFLSEGGLEFSHVMNKLLFNEAGEIDRKFTDVLYNLAKSATKENLVGDLKLLDNLDPVARKALKAEFGDEVPVLDAVQSFFGKRLEKAIETVIPTYSEEVPSFVNTLQKIANREGKVGSALGWVNSKAATLWMKWSPGFASRNWISNKFHILTDFGARGLVESFRINDNITTLNKIFGDTVPEFMTQGYGAVGKFVAAAEPGEKIKFFDWIGNNLKRSGVYEARARQSISAISMKQSWNIGKQIVYDGSILRKAGMPEDLVKNIQNILDVEYGDWNKAAPAIKELLSGEADYLKTFQWLDDENSKWMRQYDVFDQFTDGLKAAQSEEEALKVIDAIQEKMEELIKTGDKEVIFADMEDATGFGQEFAQEFREFTRYSSNDALNALYGQHKYVNKYVEESIYKNIQQIKDGAIWELRRIGVDQQEATKLIDDLIATNDEWAKLRNANYLDDTIAKQDGVLQIAKSQIQALRKAGANEDTVAEALRAFRRQGMEVNVPLNADPREVATYLFEEVWWPQQRAAFREARDGMAVNSATLTSAIHNVVLERGGQLADNLSQAYKNLFMDWESARMLDWAIAEQKGGSWDVIKLTEASGQNRQSVVKLAADNGVFTATLKGNRVVPNNQHLLAVIEKYTGRKYKNIYDIPYDVAEEAFEARRLGKEFTGVVEEAVGVERITQQIADVSLDEARAIHADYMRRLEAGTEEEIASLVDDLGIYLTSKKESPVKRITGRLNEYEQELDAGRVPPFFRKTGTVKEGDFRFPDSLMEQISEEYKQIDRIEKSQEGLVPGRVEVSREWDSWLTRNSEYAKELGVYKGEASENIKAVQKILDEWEQFKATATAADVGKVADYKSVIPKINIVGDIDSKIINDALSYFPDTIRKKLDSFIHQIAVSSEDAVIETQGHYRIATAGKNKGKGFIYVPPDISAAGLAHEMMHGVLFDKELLEVAKPGLSNMFEKIVPELNYSEARILEIRKQIQSGTLDDFAEEFLLQQFEKHPDLFLEGMQQAAADVGKVEGVGETIDGVTGVFDRGGATISNAHPYIAARPELNRRFEQLRETIRQNWGRKTEVIGGEQYAEVMQEYAKQVKTKAYEWRNQATQVAKEFGDFALHDYGDQKNIDLILGLIYPYQFWYSRTYTNWLQRIASNPAIIARYQRYKNALAKIHAGMPDYYKYQLNSNELFGLDHENPLMFNLEATLNPLNAITGVDFDDPARRTNWWTKMLDGLGRFGPSINPLLQYGTAFGLLAQGEEEAAQHWAGRLISATGSLQSAGALFGIDWLATTELDPSAKLFGDPWLNNRTGKALYQMQTEAENGNGWKGYTPEAMFDAARTQEGEVWDQARIRALKDRGYGQLASYFFGVGFKPLTRNDVELNQMYSELYSAIGMRPNMSPIEYKQLMQDLNRRYPYMDTVLTAKKVGAARDSSYAWSILSRIPPGDSRQVYEMVGIDPDVVNEFYDNKGDLSKMAESDRERFMASIIDMGAVLAMPDGMTQQRWDTAKLQYAQVTGAMESMFGDGILDEIDHYYALKNTKGDEAARAYLDANPTVSFAMDFKSSSIVNGPLELQAYYSSLNKIEGYYKGAMYDNAQRLFGENIFDLQSQYFDYDKQGRKDFLKKNPQLKEYWDYKASLMPSINTRISSVASMLPEGFDAQLRPDFTEFGTGTGAQDLFQQLQQPQDPYLTYSPAQWQDIIGEEAYMLALQALQRELEYSEDRILDRAAEKVDLETDRLIQYVGISVQKPNNMLQTNP